MNYTDSIAFNIKKLYVLRALSFAWFPIPTIILFYQSHGLDLEQAVLLKTILSLSILVLEVPSGYVADLLGRKFCLVWGSAAWIAGWLFYCFGSSFTAFAVAEVLSGVAGSLISGADTAIAYESLLQLNKEDSYRVLEGRLVAIAGVSEAVCGIIGAAIAQINLVYPFYLQTVFLLAYFAIAITLTEPKREIELDNTKQIVSLKKIALTVLKRPSLRWLMLFGSTFSIASFLMVWLSQGYFKQINVPIAAMGWIWAIFHLLMSLASINADKMATALGTKKALLGLVVILGVSYILLGSISNLWGIGFIALIYMVRGARSPLFLNLINQQIPSNIRATVLSLNSFTFHLGFTLLAPIAGAIVSAYSLSVALFVSGCFFLVFGSFCWWKLFTSQ